MIIDIDKKLLAKMIIAYCSTLYCSGCKDRSKCTKRFGHQASILECKQFVYEQLTGGDKKETLEELYE